MKITKQELLNKGFVEHITENGSFYVKGKIALVYNFNAWIPCYYTEEGPLAGRLYLEDMEELDVFMR